MQRNVWFVGTLFNYKSLKLRNEYKNGWKGIETHIFEFCIF